MKIIMILVSLLTLSSGLPLESITYLRDTSEKLSIEEVKTSSFSEVFTNNLGTDNGIYWFKIDNIQEETAILELRTSHSKDLILFDNNGISIDEIGGTRFPSYFLNTIENSFPIYLKSRFPLEAHFPLHISSQSEFAHNEKQSLLGIGFFYGTGVALIIATLVYFFITRNTQYLFFSFLTLAIILSVLAKDNVLFLFGITTDISMNLELVGHYLVGISGTGYMMFYLRLKEKQFWFKWSMLALSSFSTLALLTFFITKNIWSFALVDICTVLTSSLIWILILMISNGLKKVLLMVIYSVNFFCLLNILVLHLLGLTIIEVSQLWISIVATLNFSIIATLLLVSFNGMQSKGIIMKHKIIRYVKELQELSAYKNVQDANDNYMESLIYQFKLENIEVRILDDIAKGMSNELIAKKHSLSKVKLQDLTNTLYSKLGLDASIDIKQLSY